MKVIQFSLQLYCDYCLLLWLLFLWKEVVLEIPTFYIFLFKKKYLFLKKVFFKQSSFIFLCMDNYYIIMCE